jgi:hypothetical protein
MEQFVSRVSWDLDWLFHARLVGTYMLIGEAERGAGEEEYQGEYNGADGTPRH